MIKKILISIFLLAFTISVFAQLSTWPTVNKKQNFKDSTNVQLQKFRIGGITVTANATEINILDGALATYQELNKLVGIGTDTISTRAYSRSVGGGTGKLAIADTAAMLGHYIAREDTSTMLSHYIDRADTLAMLAHYALLTEIGTLSSFTPAGG